MYISKLKILQKFEDEKNLREYILLPLFEKMKFKVILNHGPTEFGKDIILEKTNEIKLKMFTALVVKKGNINIGSSKGSTALNDIARQVKDSFTIKYCDVIGKKEIKIDNVYVVCDGTISDNAKRNIVEQWGTSSELYEKNTTFISGETLVDLIEEYWPIFFEANSPEYYEFSKKLIEIIDKEEKVRAITINDKIFCDGKKYIKSNLLELIKLKDGTYKQFQRNIDAIFEGVERILLVGESGTGKSHILREQIRKSIDKELREENSPRLKVYIKLSEFSNRCITSECIDEIISSYVKKIWNDAPESYYRSFLDSKSIDFYLDGYDEIATEENRRNARENIIFLTATFSNSKFVVTTREISAILTQDFPKSFRRFNLSTLEYKKAIEYLESIINVSSKNGSEILRQIKQQEILLSLPRTPMTVQLISSLFSENSSQEIPSNITEVYKLFTEVMLGRWDKQRDVTNSFDYEQKLGLIEIIAFHMQNKLTDLISYNDAIEISEDFLKSYGDDESSGKRLLDELILRSELLVSDYNYVKFKHRSFQEYFTANKIHTQSLDFKEFACNVSNPWWENVITFLCGFRKDAGSIVEFILQLQGQEGVAEDLFRFRRGKNLGIYVRSGYRTNNEIKKKSLITSIEDFEFCYESEVLQERIKKIIGKMPGKKSTHIVLQMMLSHSYYSKLTQKVVFDLVDELTSEKHLSFMLKLISDFNDKIIFEHAIERINKTPEIEVKMACAIVCEAFNRNGSVKLLDSKVFRKLKKSISLVLKEEKGLILNPNLRAFKH